MSMGGDPSQIEVIWLAPNVPIDAFDALHAECADEADRDRLLITVEAAAGGLDGFNKYVQNVLSSAKATTIEALSAPAGPSWADRCAALQASSTAKWLPTVRTTPRVSRLHPEQDADTQPSEKGSAAGSAAAGAKTAAAGASIAPAGVAAAGSADAICSEATDSRAMTVPLASVDAESLSQRENTSNFPAR